MSEQKNDVEIFDSEQDIIIEPLKAEELYDIKGNLITADDAKNTLPDNTDLIQKAMDGDKQAFSELYMQSYRYVFFVVRQFIPDDETTYDVIQETFIKVYKSISRLRSPDAYYGWLTVIAKNTARDFMRTTRSESSFSEKEENYSAFLSDDETQKDVSLDIETVLKKLDPVEADLLSLVYYDGMRITQIAKMQGKPVTTVYSRLNRAKRNLKAQLNARGIDKAIYSGNFMSMITVAIRNVIGTALLSVAIAQQILDSIINGKGKKELAVAKIIRGQQKRAILKIASVIVAISVATSAATALTLIDWHRFKFSGDDNYLTSTVTEYYYETVSGDGSSSQNNGGFWGNLFGGGNTSSDTSSDNDSSNTSQKSPYYSENSSSDSSSNLQSSSSSPIPTKPNAESSVPIISDDNNTTVTDEVINTYGNNPNNVMTVNSNLDQHQTGLVAKQGEWIYYVQQYGRIMKVKTDGSDMQMILEVAGFTYVECLNVVGDTIYYINGGIWSVKTDGTDRKQHTTKSAHNLLVRGTTGWFVELTDEYPPYPTDTSCKYTLYQIDFSTNTITTLVENGVGFGLKTVVDDKLIYANGVKIYSRDLSTGSEEVIFDVSAHEQVETTIKMGIYNMLIDANCNIYVERYINNLNYGHIVYKFNLNQPNVVVEKYNQFDRIYNCFDYNGITFYTIKTGTLVFTFYDLQGNAMCEKNETLNRQGGIYTFDDGYAYYFDVNWVSLYRSRPDGSDLKVY